MTTPPDTALRDLLRRADPADDLAVSSSDDAAAFAVAVHARIRAADTAVLSSPVARLASQLYPLAAALALLASLGAGATAAYAQHQRARGEVIAAAYARGIDPWLMHTSGAHAPSTAGSAHADH